MKQMVEEYLKKGYKMGEIADLFATALNEVEASIKQKEQEDRKLRPWAYGIIDFEAMEDAATDGKLCLEHAVEVFLAALIAEMPEYKDAYGANAVSEIADELRESFRIIKNCDNNVKKFYDELFSYLK